jgi:hypothetical protein
MSLDLSILGPDGRPCEEVPLAVQEHSYIILAAQRLGLDYMLRMSDYYADTEYSRDEIPMLIGEIQILQRSDMLNEAEMDRLRWCKELCEHAIAKNCPVRVIAD